MIHAEQWTSIDALFDAALDLPPSERSRWLDEACAGDSELREQVERLLSLSEGEDERLRPSGALTGPIWREVALALAKRLGIRVPEPRFEDPHDL